MKILFLHGWNSIPGGVKPTYLKDAGHDVISPKLDDDDFEAAVKSAQGEYDQHKPDVIVGSSRGGAVAMNIKSGDTPLVLLCPAWKKWGTVKRLKPNAVILHSRADDVIPFEESEELVLKSGLREETLIEVGTDHRLADNEPLAMMLEVCERECDSIVGCDFGVPKRAGDQAKKIILIEAIKVGNKHYAVRPFGRNARTRKWLTEKRGWGHCLPGWTLPELLGSLVQEPTVVTAAMDFPFGVPQSLLNDQQFAGVAGRTTPFKSRNAWVDFLDEYLSLTFNTTKASGEMTDLSNFDYWRTDSRFWHRRGSDVAANGQPPLKHVGQNLFAMTVAGVVFLRHAEKLGFNVALAEIQDCERKTIFETYPSYVARRVGFKGSYKGQPVDCLNTAVAFLAANGIRLDFDANVRRFCEVYRTGTKKDDPDGADAFLCLVAAICFNEGDREIVRGNASDEQLCQEGGIIVPTKRPQ